MVGGVRGSFVPVGARDSKEARVPKVGGLLGVLERHYVGVGAGNLGTACSLVLF